MSISVTTVTISDEALQLLIFETSSKNELKALCDRYAAKVREQKRITREVEELESQIRQAVSKMEAKGIEL